MPLKFNWIHAQDTLIRRQRGEGSTWDAVATSLGLSRGSDIERGRRIGARPPPPEFEPPHRTTWPVARCRPGIPETGVR
jgi:hypothetical protein